MKTERIRDEKSIDSLLILLILKKIVKFREIKFKDENYFVIFTDKRQGLENY